MILKEIKIFNFRSLKDTGWIKLYDLTAFIGENDGGKTACTEALRLLFDRTNKKPEEGDYSWEYPEDNIPKQANQMILEAKLEIKASESELIAEILGEKVDLMHIKRTYSSSDNTSSFTIIGQVPEIEDFRQEWQRKTVPEIRELATRHGIDLNGATIKNDIISRITEWLKHKPTVEGEKALPPNIIPLLPRVEVFASSNAIEPETVVNNVLRLLCNNELNSGKYSGPIKEIESGITSSLNDKILEITPYIKKYYDEVEGVEIHPIFNISSGLSNVPLKLFKDGGGPIELQKKGDGKKRQVALGIYEWSTEALKNHDSHDDVILIMDEPDTHMDYHSQRKLFDIVSTYVSNSIQVIICTHSLNLINRMPINKIIHFRLDIESYTYIESLMIEDEKTEAFFINGIGLSLGLDTGTVFHERCFLLVEGATELNALPQFYRTIYGKSMHSAGIKLLSGENNSGARNFAKFLKQNNRNVVFLLDSDCKSGSHKNYFTEEKLIRDGFEIDKEVFFIGTAEFEDSFSDEVYVNLGNTYYEKSDGTSWILEDFSSKRGTDKFSNTLSNLFHDSKPNIGYNLGQVIKSTGDIPQTIVYILEKANNLANSPRK